MQTTLSQENLELLVAEYLGHLTDGIALATLQEDGVKITIDGDCAQLREPVRLAINGLLEQMAASFGIQFELVSVLCEIIVELAPSPPPPSPTLWPAARPADRPIDRTTDRPTDRLTDRLTD